MQIYKGCKWELVHFTMTKLNGIIQLNTPVLPSIIHPHVAYAVISHVEHKINFNPLKSALLYIVNYW